MRGGAALLIVLLALACVPATLPPQLAHTPGPPVIITERQYDAGAFRLRYPAGWRVISSAAGAIPAVTLVAPGDEALIFVTLGDGDSPPLPGAEYLDRTEVDGMTAWLRAPQGQQTTYEPVFAQLVASIEVVDTGN